MILSDVGEINSTVLHSDNLVSVTRLRITNAGVTGVAEGALSSFQNLVDLNVEQNLLTEISPSWFSRPTVLTDLNLSGNQIEVLNESMLSGFNNLSNLNLRKNRIRTIDSNSFSSLTNLAELDLSDNKMTRVSLQVFRSLNATRIRLDGNPWDCSCGAEDFVDFLKVTSLTSPSSPPPSDTETSVHPKSSDRPITDSTPAGITETSVSFASRPLSDPNIVCTLIAVIVFLCVLLSVVCVLAVLYRRKRRGKAVTPGSQKEEKMEVKEDDRLSHGSPGLSERRNTHWDSEIGWRRPATGVRAKSANALLFTSPFCVSGKDQTTLQTEKEASSSDTENPSERKETPGNESEAAGSIESENMTDVMNKNKKEALDEDARSVSISVNTDTVPYLSIGTNQKKQSPDDLNKQSADSQGQSQSSQRGKVMVRISTWPPTAAQWQERCKAKEQEEEGANEGVKFLKVQNEVEDLSFFDKGVKEEVATLTQDPGLSKVSKISKLNDKSSESTTDHVTDCCSHFSDAHNPSDARQEEQLKEEGIQDSDAARQTSETQKLNLDRLKPAQKLPIKSSNKVELRNEQKQAATRENRQDRRAENRSRGSKAPSDGASPDDETLLDGNEYAFMDLLHEVVQNNGRWTRDRWKQVNKQRINQQGQ
ncbi:uncharacterized protein LOC122966053 isoform X3 [Scomber scombrus]|uniref:Uncharacterized protein LOC122966053 isoform X3 n=1 Tax=Scomber scombrus TaxID=13677 RepID=A0AAV1NJK2_SCOSC